MSDSHKYLRKYGEPECDFWIELKIPIHEYCLVIPAYQECYSSFKKVWRNINANVLIIVIANAPKPDNITNNLIKALKNIASKSASHRNLSFLSTSNQPDILLIERCPIPENQGVGLARKIGADVALSMIESGLIRTPWIFNTDADVTLPSDYFESLTEAKEYGSEHSSEHSSALIYPFNHHAPREYQDACALYEASLHYYVLGLRFALSPYAYPTIGSTIVINAKSYAAVRGFPTRSAGEDFYLLNKLAKVGGIQQLSRPEISIQGRLSERVPFGTGTGIKRIMDMIDPTNDMLFYNPQAFLTLKRFLEKLNTCYETKDLESHFSASTQSGSIIVQWCQSQKLFALIKSKQSQRQSVFYKFIQDWMDGFRTLKFIHFNRDQYFASQPWQTLFDGTVLPLLGIDGKIDIKIERKRKPTSSDEFCSFLKDMLIDGAS
ncbi:MAG: hypothetical protein JKY88_17905 [Pseudomonadales bacterium]|nr:hypothetical protein [Pseudomonadales bacterium]